MSIRPLQPRDQLEWARLRRALWSDCSEAMHACEMEEYANNAGTRAVFVSAREDGRLGGFAEVSIRDRVDGSLCARVACLEGWFVEPDLRGKGIGRKLVEASERWAAARGLMEIASDAELSNTVGLKAHEALGFRETFRLVHFLKRLKVLVILAALFGSNISSHGTPLIEAKVMSVNL
jgi:aminoglycoside 6'-N-acetyltransferase I